MNSSTRKTLDRSFTGMGFVAILLVVAALAVILGPILLKGAGAFVFRETVENRRMMLDYFGRGDKAAIERERAEIAEARRPVYAALEAFEAELAAGGPALRSKHSKNLADVKKRLAALFGPAPGDRTPILPRDQYGQTRWDRALVKLNDVLYAVSYDFSDPSKMGVQVLRPRAEQFAGTSLEPMFAALESNFEAMMRPRLTFYWRFLTDASKDSHFYGGIYPEMLGTLYLTIGAMLFAVPIGVLSAIYFAEYSRGGRMIRVLRACVSTLAGAPSIVFGLFGLAFFINALHVSSNKSVLAGALTLGVLTLPIIIRASEEAIMAVPQTYKEASLSLGASQWSTVMKVILPAALPGILTGIVISMGRAAGETAPIIFTAAVSVGQPLNILQAFSQPTPALSWNIYNLATEHEAVDEIRHVQFGMALTLVAVVLALNLLAIVWRARIARKLKT